MTFRYRRWSMPVIVLSDEGVEYYIQSPEEALEHMQRGWTFRPGSQYQKARRALLSAMHGQIGAEEAREAFLAAAIEAGRIVMYPAYVDRLTAVSA
ncbi:DUF982 domain-containing protein [Rhizobium sp. L1K21]|uniref:DUF982 domain-containing protein n=1 Tax=Rhizobium sp. L1K21 TaxID=2954933 RepID=UPI002093722A|nr:DUF982 domain-containing protein [Rhizobium sp. L1K21]MCO6185668.1 DUF982 domain-containing protein [Rhizobium sp. L1K21]